ncbi:efflux transporter outer membrane subunit [Pseudomonas sp. 148P]|uniref:Efflux transporter outer membrane subunit n=1 Tax=Pseudomonas ulcerans TaxID=3115852 RepID=A0ABU7HKR5_9PSED|nr:MULTISPECIES: efflux transporter outer membrane subunit [unclassified Pseudomonas]MEE1920975.1 efflux transporter outer membrane subunit [Pseudomonas sp. 147P]MEE1932124.1 efflux transporter outer membrane subunit [Pseudomonas sp. 148P]
MNSIHLRNVVLPCAMALALPGCSVGPDYQGPPVIAASAVQASRLHRADDAIGVQPGLAHWWLAFEDAQLDSLMDLALANSPSLAAARARVRQAYAGFEFKSSDNLPKVDANAAELLRGSDSEPVSRYYLSGLTASWELDLFGAGRRASEGAEAQAQASDAELADARLQLTAQVAQAWLELRSRQLRAQKTDQALALEQRLLQLTEARYEGGTAGAGDVERLRTQVRQTEAGLIALQGQVDESLDQLALLCGQTPGSLDAGLTISAPLPRVQAPVVESPAALLRQRPDIRAAERRLAASSAQIGEQRAAAFPKVSLFGSLSLAGDSAGDLWRKGNLGWIGVPYLQWNFLDFARNRHMVEQAQARYDEALAQYSSSVLGALRDANVALSRFGHERQRVEVLRQAEASAIQSAGISEQRYRGGSRSALDWLDAERTRNEAEQQRITGEAELLASYVTLQKSLGLGWQSE